MSFKKVIDMETNKYDVFISYSRIDYKDSNNELIPNNVISKITSAFKKNHISYWIDEDGIYTGDNFAPKIAEAINDASVFVFVSSENSNSSKWVQNEVGVALEFRKPILPIKCDYSPYATSVIMYLATLDFCDYRNNSDKAIEKLVNSVKDKLPKYEKTIQNAQTRDDEGLKEVIINSITEINHQFVDISQIAISQVLEANERSRESIDELRKTVDNRSEDSLHLLDRFKDDVHLYINNLCNLLNDRFLQVHEQLDLYKKSIEETNLFLGKIYEILKSKSETEEKSSNTNQIANIIFVVDTSGSMKGNRIDNFNHNMYRLTNNFYRLFKIRDAVKIRFSVLSYSSTVKLAYDRFLEENVEYPWVHLEASGVSNLGLALNELRRRLSLADGFISNIDNAFLPLIIFISDGAPTDNWEESLKKIQKNKYFEASCKRVIALGDDAPIEMLSQLSFHEIVKICGENDMDYAIDSIISDYMNEIASGRMPLL